jgi:hypothetical protein
MTGVKLLIDPDGGTPTLDLPTTTPPEEIELSVRAVDHLRTHAAFGVQLIDRPPVTYLVIRTGRAEPGTPASQAPVEEILVYRLTRLPPQAREYTGHRIA